MTGKDLDYITDLLTQNYIFIKKLSLYIDIIEDDSIKKEIEKVSNLHKKQYDKLLSLLD